MKVISAKYLVIGSGMAGLLTALKLSQKGSVILLAKDKLDEGATRYAQGGIASVWSSSDSMESHVQDTLSVGTGLNHEDVVKICVEEGPRRVRELIELGVPFTKQENSHHLFDLHIEGGHHERRILHAGDTTGLAIERTLIERVKECKRIEILEDHVAIDLITDKKIRKRKEGRVLGAYALSTRSSQVITIHSSIVVLATGGAGKVYLYTSNPDVATGDGIAIAVRAGVRVANLEFIQFHPTCLYHADKKTFLITEALRGEGAVLRNLSGEEFMRDTHELGSLAPRDVVARAIDSEMKRRGDKHVWLDATAIGERKLKEKFPNIYSVCLSAGINLTKDPIPVVPAAHYICGGVLVNLDGQTNIPNLFAVGEVACTGLHGANRLASNSLLEAAVFSERVSKAVMEIPDSFLKENFNSESIPPWDTGMAVPLEEALDIASIWLEVRTLMWNYVGIIRNSKRLERAKRRLDLIESEVNEIYWNYLLTKDLIELRNLIAVAKAIVQCALYRKESRGLHFMVDYPGKDDDHFKRDTVL